MTDATRNIRICGSLRVLFVMAVEPEYGACLRARITPLMCGVGPVESGIRTAAALSGLASNGELPDLIFSLGSAGSKKLEHAGIYQVASVAYRDIDASPLGFEKGATPFADYPAVIAIQPRILGIPAASLSSGGAIVTGGGYDGIAADMVDMESFAIVRAGAYFGIPTVGLRGISDGRDVLTRFQDWSEYLAEIDEKLAAAVDAFTAQVCDGTFVLEAGSQAAV